MSYKVVPFRADLMRGEGDSKAASQLEALINQQAEAGWTYHGLDTLQTVVTTPAVPGTPGSNGCAGLGATPGVPGVPERRDVVQVYVAVFEKQSN